MPFTFTRRFTDLMQTRFFVATVIVLIVIFELIILFAALAAVFGMLGANKLPEPYHPVFHVKRFEHASRDQFFLAIEAVDPKFDLTETRNFMEGLKPRFVNEVPL